MTRYFKESIQNYQKKLLLQQFWINIAATQGKVSVCNLNCHWLHKGRYILTVHYLQHARSLVRSRTKAASRVSISFLREHFGRHHLHTAVNCLVNYRAGVIKTDLYITRSGECVCLVNLIKQQVQNQVIWLWCAPCENDNQTKILIWAAFTYFCMGARSVSNPPHPPSSPKKQNQTGFKWTATSNFNRSAPK